jgi:hypothetical protein
VKVIKEDKEEGASSASPGSLPQRLFRWLDKRTGVNELMKESLDEPIPGGARLAYVFGSGLIFIFISQIITGICLAIYYVPSAETAHTSVAYISKQVAAGAFLRSLHYYGSSAMIIVLALHFLQTFLYGSFKAGGNYSGSRARCSPFWCWAWASRATCCRGTRKPILPRRWARILLARSHSSETG